ncbi:MAG TPA: ABC transporter permease [Actinomycetota bacterium]|nr:ABC transporter permease [Actinomycetota bacterium]
MTRGAVGIVARREFVERIRDKGFLISTGITLLVLVVFVGAGALFAGGTAYDVGLTGPDARALGDRIVERAAAIDIEIALHAYVDVDEAERGVRDGDVDAALVDADGIVVRGDPPADLVGVLQSVSARDRAERTLAGTGLTPEEVDAALEQPPLAVRALEPLDRRQREYAAVGFIGVLALYGQLFAYGYWVAAGVVEEKSSRVVEVLLATVRPSQLLRGKILGIGVLGLCQLALIGAVGFVASQLLGGVRFPEGVVIVVGLVLVWFVLGYFFYAGLFAVAGAIVPRQEDLQSTMTPLSILIIASFFLGIQANQHPDSLLAVVTSMLPPSAPLVMPSRLILGEATVWEGLLSAAICVAATMALVPLATRIYSRSVLQRSRVRIREVLRTPSDG